MKIALVSPYPPSKVTLTEYAYYLVKHMDQNADIKEIIILTDHLEDNDEYVLEDSLIKVKIVPCWKFNGMMNLWTIGSAIRKHKPDSVFYNIQFLSFGDRKIPAALGLLSPWFAKLSGTPSVVLLHNIMETVDLSEAGITKNKLLTKAYNAIGSILTWIILRANVVAFTIPKYVEIIQEKYGAKNVVHMPHGTFEMMPEPQYSNGIVAKKQVMAFGKFGTYKKVEMMIEAVDIVRKRINEPIEIVIAGTDNPNVKGYLADVQEKYKHIEDIVFTGYVAEEDVPRIFQECTTSVFPYTSTTGSSGVLHQAGSYGKSVVLPLLGDLKELVEEEGYGGAYFDPKSRDSMANAIERILVDDAFRVSVEKQNYRAAAALSMSEIVKRYVAVFQKLSNNKTSKGSGIESKEMMFI